MKCRTSPGLTLIEVLIATSIIAALAGIGTFVSMNLYHGYMLTAERDQLIVLLQKARSRALYNTNQSPHGVYITPDRFVLFQGTLYLDPNRNPSYDEVSERDSIVAISGPSEIVFEQLTARLSGPVIFTLTQDARSISILVNQEGAIIF